MGRSILVTGGAGFIGSHLVDNLIANGNHVRVLDNLDPQIHGPGRLLPDYYNSKAEYIIGDIRNNSILRSAVKGMEIIYHLAATVGVGQSMYNIQRYVDVNCGGTASLLDVIVNEQKNRRCVKKIIVASSMSNYGEGAYVCPTHGQVSPRVRSSHQLHKHNWELSCPETVSNGICGKRLQPEPTPESKPLQATSVYAVTKKTQEELCSSISKAYEIPIVSLRFFNTYGKRQSLSNPYTGIVAIFSSRLLNNKPPMIFEDGNQSRDFVHVSDVVQANLLAMEETFPAGIYNVGTGLPIKILDIAHSLAELMNVDIKPYIYNQFRSGDIRHCYADIAKISKQGYVPRVNLTDGLADLVGWMREQEAEDLFEKASTSLQTRGLIF